jgi:hypothetical protein
MEHQLVIHKDKVLYFDGTDDEFSVRFVGFTVQVGDFTEIHIKDKYFFRKAIIRLEEER